jgi:geranylgeranyl diphosphate synthase type II
MSGLTPDPLPSTPLREYLAHQQTRIEAALNRLVPAETIAPETIHRAMRYSLFAGGKRIRPVLCMAAAETIRDNPAGIEDAPARSELVHTYSLIHDDLPALDNDDLRRGRPTSTRSSVKPSRFWRATRS